MDGWDGWMGAGMDVEWARKTIGDRLVAQTVVPIEGLPANGAHALMTSAAKKNMFQPKELDRRFTRRINPQLLCAIRQRQSGSFLRSLTVRRHPV